MLAKSKGMIMKIPGEVPYWQNRTNLEMKNLVSQIENTAESLNTSLNKANKQDRDSEIPESGKKNEDSLCYLWNTIKYCPFSRDSRGREE